MSTPVAVIGAGLMGRGIALVFAAGGHPVSIFDTRPDAARDAARGAADDGRRIGLSIPDGVELSAAPTLEAALDGAGFVTEAVIEDLAVKRALFASLAELTGAEVVLATNTSVMSITEIAADVADAGRVVGTHWWNPAPLIPLVEVVPGDRTTPQTVERTVALLTEIGKTAVAIRRDVPGFVGNRMQHALWREAIAIVEDGIAGPEEVDAIVKASFGLRLPVLGPLENADLVGLDLTRSIHEYVLPYLDARGEPSPLLAQHIERGELGMRSGRGLRAWTAEQADAVRERLLDHLTKEAAR